MTGDNANGDSTVDRRQFLKGTAGVAGLGLAAGCTGGSGGSAGTEASDGSSGSDGTESTGGTAGSSGSNTDDPLTVGVFGGIFQEMYTKHIVDPFREETGIEVEVTTTGNVPNLLKLDSLVKQGKAPVDVLIHTTETLPQGADLDLYAPLSEEEVPNLSNLYDTYRYTQDGTTYGAGIGAWYMTLIAHTGLASEPYPSSWTALWDDQYEGDFELASPLTDSYLPWLTAATQFDGQEILHTEDGIDRVFEKMAEVKPQVGKWYQNEAQGQQDIRDEATTFLEMWNDVSLVMADNDVPIERLVPEEGWIGDHGEWVVLDSSPRKEAAAEFIDFSLQAEVQTAITQGLYTAPTTENTNLSEEERQRVFGPGPDAHIQPDWTPVWDHEEYIRDKWNKFIS